MMSGKDETKINFCTSCPCHDVFFHVKKKLYMSEQLVTTASLKDI